MRADTIAALQSARKAGQSYSLSGRTKSAVDFQALQNDLAEISYAQGLLNGTTVTRTLADFSHPS